MEANNIEVPEHLYPDYFVGMEDSFTHSTYKYRTILRRESDGVYYDLHVHSDHRFDKAQIASKPLECMDQMNRRFLKEVHLHQNLFKINAQVVKAMNLQPSSCQVSERDRMQEIEDRIWNKRS
jgi:hypothetical protein